ncbi:MAG: response regulator [Candidatus Rokuibacteriota bacterium]
MAESLRRPHRLQPRPGPSLRGLRILIVEDHEDSRELLRQMVSIAGARPMVATDGREALEMLAMARPHIVLCDLRMPRLDGFEVAQRLRTNPRYRTIPLVAVTALRDDRDYLRTLEAGFDAHLAKPIEYDDLVAVLARFANRGRRR